MPEQLSPLAAAVARFLASKGGTATNRELVAELVRLGLAPEGHTAEAEGLDPDGTVSLAGVSPGPVHGR